MKNLILIPAMLIIVQCTNDKSEEMSKINSDTLCIEKHTENAMVWDNCDSILDEYDLYAGRMSKGKRRYNEIGLPTKRKWLTAREWKGRHTSGDTLKLFKAWKRRYILNFVNWISLEAVKESCVYEKIPPSLIVAQVILESNYGLSRLAHEANNLFGHKYRGKDKDMFIIAADDSPTDKFTKYRSKWFSLRAHSRLLTSKYYKRIKNKKPTLDNWLIALCGATSESRSKKFVDRGNFVYATSCYKGGYCYTNKIKNIVKKYKLYKLDE